MKYKMIISDFDGTLFRSDYSVSKASMEAINAYRTAGGLFTISTGRMYASIKQHLQSCGLDKIDLPIMNCQGAATNSSLTDKILFEQKIASQTAAKWLKYAREQGLYSQVYIDNVLYIEKWTKETDWYTDSALIGAVEVGPLDLFIQKNGHQPHKMLVMSDGITTEERVKKYNQLFGESGLIFCMSHPLLIEITSTKAGKGNMAKIVANSFGYDMKQVICVGDNQNDLTMIQAAGLGVAVGNAVQELKDVAGLVIESNDDDGVAKLIYRVLEGKI
ncbi:MAG: Cof-type HAD-IIB family hydrolase [Firmicutes bacterium]|nr:Cof-type HAD-IIB family hydrolase [Bacillota bacterium]